MSGLHRPPHATWPAAEYEVGVLFLEDTRITPEMVDRANQYDLIVAGSTWNAELLRAKEAALSFAGRIDAPIDHHLGNLRRIILGGLDHRPPVKIATLFSGEPEHVLLQIHP